MVLGVVLFFMIGRKSLPAALATFLYSNLFGKIVLVLGAVYILWRCYSFYRQPRPDYSRSDGESLAVYHTHAMLLFAALVAGFLPAVAWLLNHPSLFPGAANISTWYGGWVQNGGNPSTTLTVSGGTASGAGEGDRP